jgi:hypothetical protein
MALPCTCFPTSQSIFETSHEKATLTPSLIRLESNCEAKGHISIPARYTKPDLFDQFTKYLEVNESEYQFENRLVFS